MPDGSCLCGKTRFRYTGEVQAKALCHCTDCKKITGSTYSTNIIVPGEGFSLTSGTPKQFAKTADSGKTITSHFCGDCGSTLWRDGETFGDAKVVNVGTLDDAKTAFEEAAPGVELFAGKKPSWVGRVEGAGQLQSMPGSEEL